MAFGAFDGGARGMIRGSTAGPQVGPFASRANAEWRQRAGKVTGEDLGKLGINTLSLGPGGGLSSEEVDPAAMKFDAMMALKRAQRQGFGVEQAKQRVDDAEMAGAGVDEVLRRRQNAFNQYGEDAASGLHKQQWDPYNGSKSPLITAQTGAAIASHARAGRPVAFGNDARREFTDADARRAVHFSAQPMAQAMRGLQGARGGRF